MATRVEISVLQEGVSGRTRTRTQADFRQLIHVSLLLIQKNFFSSQLVYVFGWSNIFLFNEVVHSRLFKLTATAHDDERDEIYFFHPASLTSVTLLSWPDFSTGSSTQIKKMMTSF